MGDGRLDAFPSNALYIGNRRAFCRLFPVLDPGYEKPATPTEILLPPVKTYLVLGTLWSIDGLISGRRETLITGGLLLALQDGLDRRELATRIVNVRYTGQVANQDNYYA